MQHAGARPSAEPAPVTLRPVWLDISRPDGWTATVGVPDGGAAQIGGSPGHPALILRPRVVQSHLMVEIARVDGRPLKGQGDGGQPMVLVLDPDVPVHLTQPFPFSVRWVSEEPPPR
jgi:hypothetical protein